MDDRAPRRRRAGPDPGRGPDLHTANARARSSDSAPLVDVARLLDGARTHRTTEIVDPRSAAPSPSGSVRPDDGHADDGESLPAGAVPTVAATTTTQRAAVTAAARFMTAFAKPKPGTTRTAWWAQIKPLLSPQAVLDYAGTDPANVPYVHLTGPATLTSVGASADNVAFVAVPTDVGRYIVHLAPTPTGGWTVTRITPPSL